MKTPKALTIAGSDCSGGAGLEADLKTFTVNHVYGMAAVTCIVAETPLKVMGIQAVTPKIVRQQIACCLEGIKPIPVKTGMLFSKEIIEACRIELKQFSSQIPWLIMDPVMVATSGRKLLRDDAIRALYRMIEEHADLITPNLDEAQILSDQVIRDRETMQKAGEQIARRFGCTVLMKGGHLKDSPWAWDYLWDGTRSFWMKSPRIRHVSTHGTGCTFSAAITARLALGEDLALAVRQAKKFITRAITQSSKLGPWTALGFTQK